jgi:hypothetical protein
MKILEQQLFASSAMDELTIHSLAKHWNLFVLQMDLFYYKELSSVPSWVSYTKDTVKTVAINRYNDDNWAIFEVPDGMTFEEAANAGGW